MMPASFLKLVPVAVDGRLYLCAPLAVDMGEVVDGYLYLFHAILPHAEVLLDKLV